MTTKKKFKNTLREINWIAGSTGGRQTIAANRVGRKVGLIPKKKRN